MAKKNDYNEITVLKGLEKVRKNFGMYVGNHEDGSGLHHLLWEVLDNSVDEYMAGHCTKITVSLHKDGSCSVEDNGRGIPVKYMAAEKKTALEVALTELHAGGKFNEDNYKYSGGLHGVGVSCVNALSAKLRATVRRDGKEYTIAFMKGQKVEDFSEKNVKKPSGTVIRFAPDLTIFKKIQKFDPTAIKARLQELSFLCSGLIIEFINEKKKEKMTFGSAHGLADFVKEMAPTSLVDKPVCFSQTKDRIFVDVSLQWLASGSESEICRYYTNNIPNMDGGSHMSGFKAGLTRTMNNYISNADLPKSLKISLSGDDIREGLVAVISIRHPDPKFSSQTKDKLVSEDARSIVEQIVSDYFMDFLEQNPPVAKKIVTSCVNAYKAREAARKAREAVRKSSMSSGGLLPGKLADCQEKDPEKCELFIVEGDSAGGSAKQGRDRRFQAILPLRGKILNVEKSEFRKMMSSEEITNLIKAIGAGIGRTFKPESIRYSKIIIMTDSDVDGAHIRTLLLTFFFRQMPQLIMNGNVYIARPPLYRVVYKGSSLYMYDDASLDAFIKQQGVERIESGPGTRLKGMKLQRYKGLGEMNPDQLWETAMNPDARSMLQVTINNPVEADKIFSILMGNQVEPRREFIVEHALNVKHLDV